jgi:pyrroloquinoline quinone biosynthesis protein E
MTHLAAALEIPLAAMGEMTHRCPLQCPYCSNPVALARAADELSTQEWQRVLDELASLGVLQFHFSGGEPLARKDIVELVAHAAQAGLYTNLITSAVLLDEAKMAALAEAGLNHVQISIQGAEADSADRIAGFKGGHAKKLAAAALVRDAGLPLTLNAVMHRQNLAQLRDIIALALAMDASRLEVAHVQYYGWALKNRAALIPTPRQLDEATRIVEDARLSLKGRLVIDYVIPDYYAETPKKCMGGWAQSFLILSPSGKVLPCHAAESLTGLVFDSVRGGSLEAIWRDSPALNLYRGTEWMAEPCRSCEFREIDRGGCRCQAFALAGAAAATDPACGRSPLHREIFSLAVAEASEDRRTLVYRSYAGQYRPGG